MKLSAISLLISCLASTTLFAQHQQLDQARSRLTDADRLQIAVQKICPVMGAELGSMGEPVKVQIGQQHAFLCCDHCVGKPIDPEHWSTIQENMAKAQGICPIMGNPVTAQSNVTVVDGQQVLVCCPPCIEKIQADPKTNLTKVHSQYASFLRKALLAQGDQLQIAAQGICPVSGHKLGTMGEPVKVQVGAAEHAFLCCEECLGKQISAAHWQTIQNNLAQAQRICPVMGKPVDATMESTVVDGRKIFVCCPPCVDKIQKEPEAHLAKLNEQYAETLKQPGNLR